MQNWSRNNVDDIILVGIVILMATAENTACALAFSLPLANFV
jgi:hypothetical protein